MDEDNAVSSSYAERVGERLRDVRKRRRLSLQAVEATSKQEFKASVLGAYERGERAISVPRLQRLAQFYDVQVDHLLPKDELPKATWAVEKTSIDLTSNEASDSADDASIADRITVDLNKLHSLDGPEADLLSRYLGMIELQRQTPHGPTLTIRRDDLRALAYLFEATPAAMHGRLVDLGLRVGN